MTLAHDTEPWIRRAVHAVYWASLWPSWLRFVRACKTPEVTQRQRLFSILANNADSEYGKRFSFATIASVEEFQAVVPIVDYDTLEPLILRAAQGEKQVLCSDAVRLFELSGGSSAANKLIPHTNALLSEISESTHAWLFDLYRHRLHLLGTQAYWAISPVGRERRTTPGGIPIGIEDDTEYFGPLGRWALTKLMALDNSVARMSDMDEWRCVTLAGLLESDSLGLLSVWHPSFLTILIEYLEKNRDAVLKRLSPTRRATIATCFTSEGEFIPQRAWPKLALISCWTDGASAGFVSHLKHWFSTPDVQGKGLLATEGVVTIPVTAAKTGCPIAINGHFFEFIDLENRNARPLLAHQLRVGGRYSPLLTTSGGLYRYHLKDEVTCVGMFQKNPCLSFVGKLDATSDLRGEKITPAQVDAALAKAQSQMGIAWNFALLAPCEGNPPAYVLYVDGDLNQHQQENVQTIIEESLCESHHYQYCRQLGQLGPVCVRIVENGLAQWQDALTAQGMRAGSLKPLSLDNRLPWETIMRSKVSHQTQHPSKR